MFIDCNFGSWSLYHAVSAAVIVPTDADVFTKGTHTTEKKLPVLYLLHDETGDYSSWHRYTAVERYANEYGIIVVMPNCLDGRYRNVSVSFPGMPLEGDKYENYEAYFTRELRNWVCANFPASDDQKDSFIAGASEGAYGALYYALSGPSEYSAVGLFSPKIYSEKGKLFPELSEKLEKGALPKLYLLPENENESEFPCLYLNKIDASNKWTAWDFAVGDFIERVMSERGEG